MAAPRIEFDKYGDIPVEASGRDCPAPIEAWEQVDLGYTILQNIRDANYTKPTPIQKHSLSIVLAGRDLMGCAQTGSGKTAAFLLPILALLIKQGIPADRRDRSSKTYPLALVLAPTRELACQIHEEAKKFGFRTGLKSVVVYGGAPMNTQMYELRTGCDLLVATPGRLVDIIDRGQISLSRIKFLVLDEADRMLDMGFEPQIRQIVEQKDMPRTGHRHTLMFSATFPKEIQILASSFLSDYIFLAVGRVGAATESVTQRFIKVEEEAKNSALMGVITTVPGLTLIFVETKKKAENIGRMLQRQGIPAVSIHGDKQQALRTAAIRSFSSGQTPFLIATNVAARGLDIDNVAHVINYDMPNTIEDYVHRIGRTGRAGKTGISTSFISSSLNTHVVPKLIELLQDAKQVVPEWLFAMRPLGFKSKDRSGSRGGPRFGGKDYRKQGGDFFGSSQSSSASRPGSYSGYSGGYYPSPANVPSFNPYPGYVPPSYPTSGQSSSGTSYPASSHTPSGSSYHSSSSGRDDDRDSSRKRRDYDDDNDRSSKRHSSSSSRDSSGSSHSSHSSSSSHASTSHSSSGHSSHSGHSSLSSHPSYTSASSSSSVPSTTSSKPAYGPPVPPGFNYPSYPPMPYMYPGMYPPIMPVLPSSSSSGSAPPRY